MAATNPIPEKQTPQQLILNQVLSLIGNSYDTYWRYKHDAKNDSLPSELEILRKFLQHKSMVTINQLASEAENLLARKKEACLTNLYEIIVQAAKGENLPKITKQLHEMLREANFYQALKSKDEALALATKQKDKAKIARLHYEMGALYYEENHRLYHKEALECFNQAISLNADPEIKAYALRARASLHKSEQEKLKDLKEACELLKNLKENAEGDQIKERWRTFHAYGILLLSLEKFDLAIEPLLSARKLRPDHAHTISALVQAYSKINKYVHPLECMKQSNGLGIEDINIYYNGMGKLLWLEVARSGSVSLVEFCAKQLDKSVVDDKGNNALHHAAMEGHIEVSQVLGRWLSHELCNKAGLTPVMVAAQHGRVSLVLDLLFKQGVEPTTAKTDVLSVTIAHGQGCVLMALREEKEYRDLLVKIGKLYQKDIFAILDNKENHEKQMISAAIGQMYQTAIDAKNLAMLKLLVSYHPEGLQILYKGESPLHYAISKRFNKGVYLLVEQGSDLEQQNANKETVIPLAAKVDPELEAYLSNALKKAQQRNAFISKNISNFVENVAKQFIDTLKDKPDLKKDKNIECLKESLLSVFKKPDYHSLFENENPDLPILASSLVKALHEKIKKEGEITAKENFYSDVNFVKEKLIKLIECVMDSPWQPQRPKEANLNVQSSLDRKLELEPKMLSPTAVVFCERFEKQLDEAYGYFRGVASGELVAAQDLEDQRKIELARQVASHVPNVSTGGLSVSTLGGIAFGAMTLMLYFRQRYRRKQAERMANVFKAVTPLERAHFIRYTAEQLAQKYQHQIHHLTSGSEGVEQFADCAAARVVEYITSDDQNQVAFEPSRFSEAIRVIKSWVLDKEIPPEQRQQKSLYDIFLHGIIKVTSEFPKDRDRLQTINHLTLTDNWNSKGIFENTGVILETGERYAHKNVDIDRYGYCKGSKEEALKRNLSLNSSKEQLWGAGRQWEKPEDTQALSPTPGNQASEKPILTAYQNTAQNLSLSPPSSPGGSAFKLMPATS